MEQELLKDDIEETDRVGVEPSQASEVETASPSAIGIEPSEAEYSENIPVEEPAAEQLPGLEVVDPYTAAPPVNALNAPRPELIHENAGENSQFQDNAPLEDPFVPIPYAPATPAETVRRSGLAWSAGVAFFGSVAFTLFLGWLVDLLLGTSPWGIVGGIILGSVIGFLQFFRITSQIFPSKSSSPVETTLMGPNDDERP